MTSAPTLIAEKYITPEVVRIFSVSEHFATTIVYVCAFLSILLFWEIASKIIGVRFSDSIALRVAPVYQILVWLFLPVTLLVEIFMKVFGWMLWWKIDFHGQSKITGEELEAFIDMSHEWWAVEMDEKRQIKNLLSLGDTTAESVMTPRVNVEFLSLDMSIDEACEFLMDASHSRIPVFGENSDDVNFVITFREAFKLKSQWLGSTKLSELELEKIMKIPLTQALDDLFEKFQKSRRHIALVMDEHGGTAGVVTMEDVLEEVFWDIKDEKDKEEIYMKRREDGSIEAVGTALIDDILEEFNLHGEDIELPEEYIGEPLSYIIMAVEEAFPAIGTEVIFGHSLSISLRVLSLEDKVIGKVECRKIEHK